MSKERIMTLHPDEGKQGTNIERHKYDQAKAAIIDALSEHGELSFWELVDHAKVRLGQDFDGSPNWYVTTVKLDLQARGVIEEISKRPIRLRLADQSAK